MGIEQEVNEAAEAVCAGLYFNSFTHQGDTDLGQTSWFVRGRTPKVLRVRVERSHKFGMVFLTLEWPNTALPGRIRRGYLYTQVDCHGTRELTEAATTQAVLRCLEVFLDVLQQTGVASREAALAPPGQARG